VASWLPGTEGEGVADVLFGRVGFTGQLSLSWPREASQEPINVGDATYNPLYPFGWGLTTSASGNHRATEADLRLARSIVAGTKTESAATLTRLVTGVRLLVQARVPANATGVPSATSVAIANADVAALRGDRIKALRTLLGALHG
jgi:beta-glucosidase